MAVDIFLKLEPIKGESMDAKHKKEIDILAWSWGMSQSGTTHQGPGGGSGKVSVNDISLTKHVDASSHDLIKHCCNGAHIDEGTIIVRKAGKTPLEYIKIVMKEIIITSVSTGGHGSEDRLTENVTLNFAKFFYKYVSQTDKGGKGAEHDANWDIAGNVEA